MVQILANRHPILQVNNGDFAPAMQGERILQSHIAQQVFILQMGWNQLSALTAVPLGKKAEILWITLRLSPFSSQESPEIVYLAQKVLPLQQ